MFYVSFLISTEGLHIFGGERTLKISLDVFSFVCTTGFQSTLACCECTELALVKSYYEV